MHLPGTAEYVEDILHIGGCSTLELAETFKTPLLVYDEEHIRSNCRYFMRLLQTTGVEFRLYYAGKAFLSTGLLRLLTSEGLGLDAVSGGELYQAEVCAFPPHKIILHGHNKQVPEIIQAIKQGVHAVVVDSFNELQSLEAIAQTLKKRVPVMLRITPQLEALTHPHLQTGVGSKFGFRVQGGQARAAIEKAGTSSLLLLRGLHCHLGSQITDTGPYKEAADTILQLAEENTRFWHETIAINLGGGFAIAHHKGERAFPLTFLAELVNYVITEAKSAGLPRVVVEFEPGRSIIGPAGSTLYMVGDIKYVPGNGNLIAVDGGMADNIRPALYGAAYTALHATPKGRTEKQVNLVGRLCESGDTIIKGIRMPEVKTGDHVLIPNTGAYTYAMASNYNGLPRPAVILVRNGQAHTLFRRETYADLVARQEIPAHLQTEEYPITI